MTEGKDLLTVLWSGADVLRGKMDVKYEAYNYRDGELANENKLRDSADYAAYKEAVSDALPKFKFRGLMIDEFRDVLMWEIAPLID